MIKKYEFKVLTINVDYEASKIEEAQNEGWELAGAVSTQYHGSPTEQVFTSIPFKREIEEETPHQWLWFKIGGEIIEGTYSDLELGVLVREEYYKMKSEKTKQSIF